MASLASRLSFHRCGIAAANFTQSNTSYRKGVHYWGTILMMNPQQGLSTRTRYSSSHHPPTAAASTQSKLRCYLQRHINYTYSLFTVPEFNWNLLQTESVSWLQLVNVHNGNAVYFIKYQLSSPGFKCECVEAASRTNNFLCKLHRNKLNIEND